MPSDLRFFDSLRDIPKDVEAAWTREASASFFLSRWWFETIISAGLGPGDRPWIGALTERDGGLRAILPGRMVSRRFFGTIRVAEYQSLTGIYSCYFRPIIAEAAATETFGIQIGRLLGRKNIIHLNALDRDWSGLAAFECGLVRAGLAVERYDHFGNWSEEMGGRSFDQYLRDRDGALRETLRRKARTLERRGNVSYEIISRPDRLDEGIAAYEEVYRQSWKEPEPYPKFQPLLMRTACREGALRLGICRLEGIPVAAQLWIIWNGVATLLKLAHIESAAKLSVGSVLTAYMIRRLMDEDGATKIDFGRGDDSYKSRWTTRREQRIGLLAANPASVQGLAVLARQVAGRWRRKRRSGEAIGTEIN